MRIRSIDCRYFEMPLEPPIADARNTIQGRSCLLVRVETEDGLVGWGEAASFAGSGRLAYAAVKQLEPMLKEHDSRYVPKVFDDCYHLTQHYGRRGVVLSALSAIDVALWDIAGKRAQMPLFQLFGASRDRIRYYFNSGYYVPGESAKSCWASLESSVAQAVERKATATKIKIGRFGLRDDCERIKRARAVLGPDRDLMVDANGILERHTLRRLDPVMVHEEVRWVEEPVPLKSVGKLGQLAAEIQTPIAGYELEMTTDGYGDLLAAGAVSVVQPDTIWSGGFTECRRVASLAQYFDAELIPHNFASIIALAANAHLAASAKTGGWLEVDSNPNPFLWDLAGDSEWDLKDGFIVLPSGAGLGVEPNLDAIANYEVPL